jgi:integrase
MEKYRPEKTDKHIFHVYGRGYMGKLLKEIAKICGIGHISFHKARHNFGTHITLSQGVPIETVSRMMGHKNIATTQIYAKVTDRKVDEDMKRLRMRTASKANKVALSENESLRAAIRYPGEKRKNKNVQLSNNE